MSHRSNYIDSDWNSRNQSSRFMRSSDDNFQQYGGSGGNKDAVQQRDFYFGKKGNANDNSTLEERKSFFRQLGLPRHEVFEYAVRSFEAPAFDLDYFEYRMHQMQNQHLNEADIRRQLLSEARNMLQAPLSNSQQSSRNVRRSVSPLAPPPPIIQGHLETNNSVYNSRARSPPRNVSNGNKHFRSQSASSFRNGNLDTKNNWQTSQQQRDRDQLLNKNQRQSSVQTLFNRRSGPSNFEDTVQQRGPSFVKNSGPASSFLNPSDNFSSMNAMNNFSIMDSMSNLNNMNHGNNMGNMSHMNNMSNMNPMNNMSNMNRMNNMNNMSNMSNMSDMNNMNNARGGGFDNFNQFDQQNWNEFQSNVSNRSNRIEPIFNNSGPHYDNFGPRFDSSGPRLNDSRDRSSRLNNSRDRSSRLNSSRDRRSRKRGSSQLKPSTSKNQMPPPKEKPKPVPSQTKVQPSRDASATVRGDPFIRQQVETIKHHLETGKHVHETSVHETARPSKRAKQERAKLRERLASIPDEFMRPELFGDIGRPKPKGYMSREEFFKWYDANKWIEGKLMRVDDNDPALINIFFAEKDKALNHSKLVTCEENIEKAVNILDDWRLHNFAFEFLKSKAIANEFLYLAKWGYLGYSGQRCLGRIFDTLRKANMIAFYKAIIQEYCKIYRKDFSLGYTPLLKELLHDKAFNWLVDLAFKEIKLFAEPVRNFFSNKLKSKLKELYKYAVKKNKQRSKNPYKTVNDHNKSEYVTNIMKKMEEILNDKPNLEYANCKVFMDYKLRLANKSLDKQLKKEVFEQRSAFLTKLKTDEYVQNVELYMARKLFNIYNRLKYLKAVHPRMISREDLQQMLVFEKFVIDENLTLIGQHIFDEWIEIYGNISHPKICSNMQRPMHKAGKEESTNEEIDEYEDDEEDGENVNGNEKNNAVIEQAIVKQIVDMNTHENEDDADVDGNENAEIEQAEKSQAIVEQDVDMTSQEKVDENNEDEYWEGDNDDNYQEGEEVAEDNVVEIIDDDNDENIAEQVENASGDKK